MATQSTGEATRDTRIRGPWLTVVRAIWLAFSLLLIVIFIAGISPRFDELRTACAGENCAFLSLSPEEANALLDIGLSMESYALYQVIWTEILVAGIFALVGMLIFWRRSDDWIGIMVSLTIMLFGLTFAEAGAALGRLYPSLRLPLHELTSFGAVLLVLLFYLFPDGRFVPSWTRLPAIVLAVVALVDPLLPIRSGVIPSGTFSLLVLILLLGSLAVGIFAQVHRYRRVSTPAQRQQTKWVVFGLLTILIPLLTWSVLVELFPLHSGRARLIFNSVGFAILMPVVMIFPLSIVFAILRYRLWDIDIVINRALVYSVLTATLAAVYGGTVIGMQALFRAATGQQSDIAIVISTLAIFALSVPLRRRIQNIIDRRFYRRRYDAARTLAAFSARMRNEVDVDRLTGELVAVVAGTMQPTHASIWLREGNRNVSRNDPQTMVH